MRFPSASSSRLLLGLLLVTAPVLAQSSGVSGLLSSGSSSMEVEADPVTRAASQSFRFTIDRRLRLDEDDGRAPGEPPPIDRERRETLADEAERAFTDAVEHELAVLRGDGLLLADEVSTSLGALREEHLDRLEELVRAAESGHDPPPAADEYTDGWKYRAALLRYVVVQRNDLASFGVLLGATLAGFVLAVGVLKLSGRKVDGEGRRWSGALHALVDSLNGPLYLLFATGGLALGLRAIWLPLSFFEPVRMLLLLLVVVGVFWIAWRLSSTLPTRVGDWVTPRGTRPSEGIVEVVRKMVRLGLILAFVFLGVEVVVGADLTAFLAGVGIVGLAITLAAQDTLKDLLATLTLHVNGPFELGDLVRYAGYFGTIEAIGFRMTRIRTLDGHLVTVPNAKLVSEPVENVDARPHVRRRFHIDLPYDTPVERIRAAVETVHEVIDGAGGLDPDQDVQVHFDEFGPHSLRLLVQYYFESGDYWAAKEKATEIDLALVERFREIGVDFAFPTQTLHVVGEPPPADEAGEARERARADSETDGSADDDADAD